LALDLAKSLTQKNVLKVFSDLQASFQKFENHFK